VCLVKESAVELLQKDFDRVLRISRYAERSGVYENSELEQKALEFFFITPEEAQTVVRMALARVQRALSRGLIS